MSLASPDADKSLQHVPLDSSLTGVVKVRQGQSRVTPAYLLTSKLYRRLPMGAHAIMPTGLPDIQAGQLPPNALTTTCHTWTVGPLTIEGCIDTQADVVTGSVSLLGVTLDHFTLDANEVTDTIGGSIGDFKAEATVTVDIHHHTWSIAAELCAPIVGCKDYSSKHTW